MVMYYRLRSGKPVVTGELGTDHQRALRCMTDDRNMEPEGEQYDEKDYAKNAWQNLMGGGYACYYNRYMCWDVIEYDSVPRGFQYFKLMRDFFAPFDLSEFTPAPELSAWSGVVLDDRKTKILLYMEPKHDDRYNFFDRAVTLLNPANGTSALLRLEYSAERLRIYLRSRQPFLAVMLMIIWQIIFIWI